MSSTVQDWGCELSGHALLLLLLSPDDVDDCACICSYCCSSFTSSCLFLVKGLRVNVAVGVVVLLVLVVLVVSEVFVVRERVEF